jgi:hypothetical protein
MAVLDFATARNNAFDVISTMYDVDRITAIGRNDNTHVEMWNVEDQIEVGGRLVRVSFTVKFPFDFPLALPKIFVELKGLGCLPHIDMNGFVCTFDTAITSIRDDADPGVLVYQSLSKAKRIIEAGLSGENTADFEGEFIAYWENKYSDRDRLNTGVASLIDQKISASDPVKILRLRKRWGLFDYVLFSDDINIQPIKDAIDDAGITYVESHTFYVDELPIDRPPFELTNKAAIALLSNQSPDLLKRFAEYMDESEHPIVIFRKTISQRSLYFGWEHDKYREERGFRPGRASSYHALQRSHLLDRVTRLSPKILATNRMVRRTSFLTESNSLSFCFVGLGSIGSNLYSFLRSLHPKECRMIDPEFLQIENIGRHFLGFHYCGMNKALAIKRFIHTNHPTCLAKVIAGESVVKVICERPRFINDCDYSFVCIGKTEIELWIDKTMQRRGIVKPIFYLWVEPYLAGGHCVFVHPNSQKHLGDLFVDQSYINNVIAKRSYELSDSILTRREAGCQTSFTPYSFASITSFLSSLFPYISDVMRSRSEQSRCYTWIGDLPRLASLGLDVDAQYRGMPTGSIVTKEIR